MNIIRFIFIFVLSISFSSIAAQEKKKKGKVTTSHSNNKRASVGRVSNYQKQGLWKYWDENGTLIRTEVYKNDTLNGLYTKYTSNGQKLSEGNYSNGKRNGKWLEWYPDGKLHASVSYLNGQYHGLFQNWYPNEQLMQEGLYENGTQISYKNWYENGRLKRVEYYRNGKRDGEWREYSSHITDTMPQLIKNYSNGLLHGVTIMYNGDKKEEETYYNQGKLDSTHRRWNKSEELILEENYKNGNLHGTYFIHFDYGLLTKGNYLNGSKHGLFTTTSDYGQLIKREWFTQGQQDSLHKFYPDGRIASRTILISFVKTGEKKIEMDHRGRLILKGEYLKERYLEYDQNGMLTVSGNILNQHKDSIWTTYYSNGKKQSETPYSNDIVEGTYRKWYSNGKPLIEAVCSDGKVYTTLKLWSSQGKLLSKDAKGYIDSLFIHIPREININPYKSAYLHVSSFIHIEESDQIQAIDEDEIEEVTHNESNADSVYSFAEEMPMFPGGQDSLNAYIIRTIRYPIEAKAAGLQGTVYINFIVEKDGSVSNINVIKGIKEGMVLEQEAVRVVKTMPKWNPGKMDSKPVRVNYYLPIRFVLAK
jgi:TonB family protein